MLKNRVMKQQSRRYKIARKARAIANANVHCKMTSVITLRNSSTIAGFLQCSGGKLEEAEDFNVFSSFTACSNRNRSALARS